MCGIFGIVTEREQNLGSILIDAARRLTYRGYDSVGAATIGGSKIDLRKDVGKVDEVAEKYKLADMSGKRGITQLRLPLQVRNLYCGLIVAHTANILIKQAISGKPIRKRQMRISGVLSMAQ